MQYEYRNPKAQDGVVYSTAELTPVAPFSRRVHSVRTLAAYKRAQAACERMWRAKGIWEDDDAN
jgi:hypothetical protein